MRHPILTLALICFDVLLWAITALGFLFAHHLAHHFFLYLLILALTGIIGIVALVVLVLLLAALVF